MPDTKQKKPQPSNKPEKMPEKMPQEAPQGDRGDPDQDKDRDIKEPDLDDEIDTGEHAPVTQRNPAMANRDVERESE